MDTQYMIRRHKQQGFSLLEVLVAVLVMGIVAGGVLSQVEVAIRRSNAEQVKLDNLQEARDFVDQFFRDINQIGYPNIRMASTAAAWPTPLVTQNSYTWASPYINDNRFAIGLVKIDANEIRFEADANGDGNVQTIVYMINGSGACALCLQRSQVDKVAANPLTGQTPSWGTEVNDLVNTNPIFSYFKADGTAVVGLPIDLSSQAGAQTLASIKTIQISLVIRNNAVKDLKTGLPIETSFEGEVSLNNCSMAAAYSSTLAPMGCQ
jgi:prepilin-type N-terminal cleavage/methylation domain-containing protein